MMLAALPLLLAAPAAPLANGSFDLEAGGRTIHYEVHGKGPVLMALTNSWGLTLEGLRGLYEPLEERLTLVYFDPRGMGRSSPAKTDEDRGMAAVREDFDALRRHLGIDKANVIGWSNGAMNLLLLAAEKPDTIASAVFVHGVASYGPEDMKHFAETYPEMTARFVAFQKEQSDPKLTDEQRTARQRTMWMEEYFPFLLAEPKLTKARFEQAFRGQPFSAPHTRQTNKESEGFDARPRLGRITARALVIAGAKDAAPPAKVKEIADGIQGAQFVVFEKSGHFAPLEEPEGFRNAVFGFLGVR
jgi:pimeloyl-ACP methyl ester carboxylesterase